MKEMNLKDTQLMMPDTLDVRKMDKMINGNWKSWYNYKSCIYGVEHCKLLKTLNGFMLRYM